MNKSKTLALWALCGALSLPVVSLHSQEAAAAAGGRRLTLSEAVRLAQQNNRAIRLAQATVSLAEAERQVLKSQFRPQIFVGSGVAATRGFPLSIEGSAPSIFQVASSQAFFNPSLRNLEKQAGQMRVSAEKSLEEARDRVAADTVLTYLDLDRSRRSLGYARNQVASLLAAEGIVEERVRAGLEPALESTRARLSTARARSAQVALENQIALLEYRLRDVTGIPQSETVQTEPAQVPAMPPEETLERLASRALENNPGLLASEEEVRAKEFQVKSEQASRWPRVNLVGQYGLFSNINNYSQYFQKFSRNNATLGISVVVPLYQRERYAASLSKAEAELSQARSRLSEAEAAITRQVRELWSVVQQQAASREVVRLELELARRTLDATLAEYELGKVSRLAVEQARLEESKGWVSLYEAEFQQEKARLELLRATGEIRSVFP